MARANETETKLVISGEDRTRAAVMSAKRNLGELDGAVLGLRSSFNGLSGIGMGGGLIGVATAIGAGLGVMAKHAADVQDGFHKMSQRVGISTETLSGWTYAAKLADVSQDELGTGLKQLSKNLIAGDEAFAALGITTKESDVAFLQIADRFARMEDGAGKTALAMRIFGKSGADLIPLLNGGSAGLREMSDEAKTMGLIVSTEAAQAAEKFNDNLTRLSAGLDGVKMKIGNAVIPLISELSEEFIRGTETAGGFWKALGMFGTMNPFKDVTTHVKELSEEIADLERRIPNLKTDFARERAQSQLGEKRKKLQFVLGEESGKYEDGSSYIPDFDMPTPKKGKAPEVVSDSARQSAARKAVQERTWLANQLAEGEEEFEKERMEALVLYGAFKRKQADEDQLRELTKHNAWMELYDERTEAEEEAERAAGLAANDGMSYLQAQQKGLKENDNIAKEIGLTFTSALEDAIVRGGSLSDVFRGMQQDIVRMGVRKMITEPLLEAVNLLQSGAGKSGGGLGGFLGSLVGMFGFGGGDPYKGLNYSAADKAELASGAATNWAHGGVFNSPSLSRYSGGVFNSPQMFAFASGAGVFAEAGPEAIMPLTRGRNGKLGVQSSGSGGNVTVNILQGAGTRAKVTSQRQGPTGTELEIITEQIEENMSSRIAQGRGLASTLESTYGLDRSNSSRR